MRLTQIRYIWHRKQIQGNVVEDKQFDKTVCITYEFIFFLNVSCPSVYYFNIWIPMEVGSAVAFK